MYYVYALVDPIKKIPFYIGKGKGKRMYDHLNGRDILNTKKHEYIENIRRLGYEPQALKIIDIEDSDEAYEWEYFFIKECIRLQIPITNRVGVIKPPSRKGIIWNPEWSEKRRQTIKANGGWKRPKSTHQRMLLSLALKGRPNPRKVIVDVEEVRYHYITLNETKNEVKQHLGISQAVLNRVIKENKLYKIPQNSLSKS